MSGRSWVRILSGIQNFFSVPGSCHNWSFHLIISAFTELKMYHLWYLPAHFYLPVCYQGRWFWSVVGPYKEFGCGSAGLICILCHIRPPCLLPYTCKDPIPLQIQQSPPNISVKKPQAIKWLSNSTYMLVQSRDCHEPGKRQGIQPQSPSPPLPVFTDGSCGEIFTKSQKLTRLIS